MQKPNLSQSLLKAYLDYYSEDVKACGLQLYNQFFLKIPTPPSDAARLGIYFEYLATGYLRDGEAPPQPDIVYKGTPKEKLSAEYERATKSAELFKKMIKDHNIEILQYGEYMLHDGASGISDIRANWDGEECIIDVKYTSLFDDKFNEYGWHTESLVFKSKLLLQPIHYKYLARKKFNQDNIPFYFFVFSAKDPEKAKIIGYMAIPYSPNSNDYILEPMTASDIDFIIVNDLDIEVEMIDEFTAPDEYADVGLFDGERKPKLHKGKIIIHIK
jgi:hypothetical protein